MTEGYIKFNCEWEQKEIRIPELVFQTLEEQRTRLFELGLIGMYPDGIGFGNISVKSQTDDSFFITGSATGQYAKLALSHYAKVSAYNFKQNSIDCIGLTKASAESLTHAAIYESGPEVAAVVHVHCLWLWEELLKSYPATSAEIEYGTPEMAFAVKQLATELKYSDEKVIVMGGHKEGILAFGKSLEEVTNTLFNLYNRFRND